MGPDQIGKFFICVLPGVHVKEKKYACSGLRKVVDPEKLGRASGNKQKGAWRYRRQRWRSPIHTKDGVNGTAAKQRCETPKREMGHVK